jgi:hypothetical protein
MASDEIAEALLASEVVTVPLEPKVVSSFSALL